MLKIKFTKMVAAGNDFVVIESVNSRMNLKKLSLQICDRKFGVGADGMLILSKVGPGVVRMRIFNSDGSQAEMCGNGARCAALYWASKEPCLSRRQARAKSQELRIETKAGIIKAKVEGCNIKINLTEPGDLKLEIPLKVNGRRLKVNFINTGVPHAVIPVSEVDKINVKDIGRQIRLHKKFSPAGTNVDFIEILSKDAIKIRTYERGVEDETLACGTGSAAAVLILALKTDDASGKINVHTKGGEVLKVYFKRDKNKFSDVWLEGKARIVYKGEYLCLKAL